MEWTEEKNWGLATLGFTAFLIVLLIQVPTCEKIQKDSYDNCVNKTQKPLECKQKE